MKTENEKTATDAMPDAWADALESEERDPIEETLYLTSIPDMEESLRTGMTEPIKNCLEESQVWK